ncbi:MULTISPECIES: GNAT family N-acetyltransferase [unclassified Streptomyces]|uniref:GNAT family N-acetyltransferase n=1 Tax=Streptomyces TaxID=1883 RepID=UPI000CD5408D|nr:MULTISPECIES: GNAT family N-acetyltransferase [unclassified Streptomyces]AWL40542.1 N-acetyltransferase [Streptomyces sp. SM18]
MTGPRRPHASGGVLLRPWRPSDAPAVLRAFAPSEMARQSGGHPVTTRAEALDWIARWERERTAGTGYAWAAVRATGQGEALGCVAVTAVNQVHGCGWVSYWTTEAARGSGVASAGVRALARWAFDDLGLYRLELGHRTDNPASCAVARRAGFIAEGIERGKLRYEGVRHDVERHARLATDPVNFG